MAETLNIQEEVRRRADKIYRRRLESSIAGTPERDWEIAQLDLGVHPKVILRLAHSAYKRRCAYGQAGSAESDYLKVERDSYLAARSRAGFYIARAS